jgi:hypothetical protein
MRTSLFSGADSWYTSRISEYVIPPAMKTINLLRLLVGALTRGPLCQFAFALRSDVVGGGGAAFATETAPDNGASFT